MKNKIPIYTYVILLTILVIYLVSPILNLNLKMDANVVGIASLIVILSFALIIIEELPRIRKIKMSATGIEAELDKLKQEAEQLEISPSEESKIEVQEIISSDLRNPTGSLLELIIEIEKKIRLISEKLGYKSWRYESAYKLSYILQEKEVLNEKELAIFRSFWKIRNRIIHGDLEITQSVLEDAINLGERLLSKLDSKYKEMEREN